jgi:ribosomal protein S18 acetylase RimI-like enzyme
MTGIAVRRAVLTDAPAIGAVHVASWRSAYPGILPDSYLASLSVEREASGYAASIRVGEGVFVATNSSPDGKPGRVVGFASARRARQGAPAAGEIQTLYVLDDFRERGAGRMLLSRAGAYLMTMGCESAFLWVLRDNPARFFYDHLGGKPVQESTLQWAGTSLVQVAYVWPRIGMLWGEDGT